MINPYLQQCYWTAHIQLSTNGPSVRTECLSSPCFLSLSSRQSLSLKAAGFLEGHNITVQVNIAVTTPPQYTHNIYICLPLCPLFGAGFFQKDHSVTNFLQQYSLRIFRTCTAPELLTLLII